MTPKTHLVLEMAVESGVTLGYARAFKHDDNPTGHRIKELIVESVLTELYEWFDIESEKHTQISDDLVAEEREQCARIVESYTGAWDDAGYALAQAIRGRA